MPTLFKEVNYNLATLIQQIDLGIIGLPDIQRPFVWPDTKVRDLYKIKMYFWHALPEDWEKLSYSDFLIERRKRIADVIKTAYDKICQ